ncbi:MAG: class I SAM-dependent methyltransferase [Hyphomonadaceae bacterium]|nr:class I SAM-dependent methyltransferase [Hyphomonadaceae bacterium]
MADASFDGGALDSFDGMITGEEAQLLHRLAAELEAGCIVEIGSWRGKSAIAMAMGARLQPPDRRSIVYCVEPHAEFIGLYGGRFGPDDRKAFFEAVLRADCADAVALINLPSAAAGRAWSQPIGMLFIDGDHSVEGVKADVELWTPFLVDGGYIVFDDALDPEAGPAHAIARLLASGRYARACAAGKVVALQKLPDTEAERAERTRRNAAAAVRVRALAAGYDPEVAVRRLSYGSFVSLKHRYVYVETPKAACTSWKRVIARVEQASVEENSPPYHRESRLEMLIHQRRYVDIPTLLDVEESEHAAILDGDPEWFVFGLCRNPYSRVVSVFENKVRLREPHYADLHRRYGGAGAYAEVKQAFAAFVREVVSVAAFRNADAHLCPQTDLLMPRLMPYTKLFKVEEMDAALNAFSSHLAAHGCQQGVTLERLNETVSWPWRAYYDELSAAAVASAYEQDFAAFGYDRSDWRSDANATSPPVDESAWRAQVVDRNAMIDRLYDWLAQR